MGITQVSKRCSSSNGKASIYLLLEKQETWRRNWKCAPVFLPGEFHRQRSLVGYSLWSCKESGITEQLTHTDTYTQDIYCFFWKVLFVAISLKSNCSFIFFHAFQQDGLLDGWMDRCVIKELEQYANCEIKEGVGMWAFTLQLKFV